MSIGRRDFNKVLAGLPFFGALSFFSDKSAKANSLDYQTFDQDQIGNGDHEIVVGLNTETNETYQIPHRNWDWDQTKSKPIPASEVKELSDILKSNVQGGTMNLVWGPDLEFERTECHGFRSEDVISVNVTTSYDLEPIFEVCQTAIYENGISPLTIELDIDLKYKGQLVTMGLKTFGDDKKTWSTEKSPTSSVLSSQWNTGSSGCRTYYTVENCDIARNGIPLDQVLEDSDMLNDRYEVEIKTACGTDVSVVKIVDLRLTHLTFGPLLKEAALGKGI